jgi:hypothetical protein
LLLLLLVLLLLLLLLLMMMMMTMMTMMTRTKRTRMRTVIEMKMGPWWRSGWATQSGATAHVARLDQATQWPGALDRCTGVRVHRARIDDTGAPCRSSSFVAGTGCTPSFVVWNAPAWNDRSG